MPSVSILYASTSGHTEYVVGVLAEELKQKHPTCALTIKSVEHAVPADLTSADILVLASGTWNTNNVEGQLNPHMYHYLMELCRDVDLTGRTIAVIGLGDQRYRYLAWAALQLERFVEEHKGTLLKPTLRVINEPYGQEDHVRAWVSHLPLSA